MNHQKKRCWGCKSLNVILWGKQKDKQRFKCKNCGLLFTDKKPEQCLKNRLFWFKKWVIERLTYKTLVRDSGYSKDTLQRTFYAILEQAPKIKIIQRNNVNLRMDATYFQKFCLVCYQDDFDGYTQLIRFTDKEYYFEMKEDLENFIKLGIQIESVTTDGHKSILKAIKKAIPDAKVQRCLVHIHRMRLIWLTRYPKHIAGQELRSIVLMLLEIKTENDKAFCIQEFNHWFERQCVWHDSIETRGFRV
ncbi:transposase [Pedobacter petrophilus]